MKFAAALISAAVLGACQGDETVRAYGADDQIWTLTELNGEPFNAKATLLFPEPGSIAGDAPCNSYTATMSAPYPWFEAGPIAATRRACPDLATESVFLAALSAASLSEVAGDTLILSNPDGLSMVFTATD
ncbi:META domain-containing protein [Sulfitobacter sp. SK012]|uniref:META domain-containing protein n=1 Tax=Sulfitobacter sp. SK012 TaxID=1389005 RepID=UPI000E0A722D|nr:META domain-containing protein [Sulfitobacter sp. SK012]AXI45068.1 META domain-containing protein [Sulfitobacter sp. SK012]